MTAPRHEAPEATPEGITEAKRGLFWDFTRGKPKMGCGASSQGGSAYKNTTSDAAAAEQEKLLEEKFSLRLRAVVKIQCLFRLSAAKRKVRSLSALPFHLPIVPPPSPLLYEPPQYITYRWH